MTNAQVVRPSLETIITQLQQEFPSLQSKFDVERLAVFGSYARREEKNDSDLDILVQFRITPGLLRYIALEQYLSDRLGVSVDLVMESALRPEIAPHIHADAITI